jgi:hypothetical protein
MRHILPATALLVLLVPVLLAPLSANGATNGQQIMFVTKGTPFTYLKIEGRNQNDQDTVWETVDPNGRYVVVTLDWWWKDFTRLTFDTRDLGRRYCNLDYIGEGYDWVMVSYTAGQDYCTGDQGSARDPLESYAEAWMNALAAKDRDTGVQVTENLNLAYDAFDCLKALPDVAGSPVSAVMLPFACKGVSLELMQKATEKVLLPPQ